MLHARFIHTLLLCCATLTAWAQTLPLANEDLNAPFGWATMASIEGGSYEVTGGQGTEHPATVYLTSAKGDMRGMLSEAIHTYQIIVLDGSHGDFFVSASIEMEGLRDKTIVGIHGAKICTQFVVTPELTTMLDSVGVQAASAAGGTGGLLSNGVKVGEERERLTRQSIIDYTDDETELYRHAGIFLMRGCENIIIRNLVLQGPGAIDVGGWDVITCSASKHIWIDHCELYDGMDGNLDINAGADCITCSWTTFCYGPRSYDHRNSNLVGSGDWRESDENFLNVTYACCQWGKEVNARMPMARYGTLHMLNNYYTCAGNGSPCINPRRHSEFLIEGNYFAAGVRRIFAQSEALRWTWSPDNYAVDAVAPQSSGSPVTMPYSYPIIPTAQVPEIVGRHAGATLEEPLRIEKKE